MPSVLLRFLGDDSDLSDTLGHVEKAVGRLGIAVGGVGALGAAAGAVVAAGAVGAVAAIGGLGVAFAAQNAKVASSFTALGDHVQKTMQDLAKPITPVLVQIAGDTREAFDDIAPQLGAMFKTVAPFLRQLANGVLSLIQNIMPGINALVSAAGPVITSLSVGFGALGDALSGFLTGLSSGAGGAAAALDGIFAIVGAILPVLGQLIGTLATALAPVFTALVPIVTTLATALGQILTPLIQVLGPVFTQIATALAGALIPAIQLMADSFVALMPVIGPIITQIGDLLVQAINTLAPLLPPLIDAFFQIVAALLPIIPPLIQIVSDLMPLMGDILGVVVGIITNIVVPAIQFLAGVLVFLAERAALMASKIAEAWEWIKGVIPDAVSNISGWLDRLGQYFRDLPGNVLRAVGNLGSLLVNAGGDILTGLWNGIQGMGGWLRDRLFGFFNSLVPDWARDALGIGSPSKVFAEIGKWVPEGMAQGIEGNAQVVQTAVTGMAGVTVPVGAPATGSGQMGGPGGVAVTFDGNTSDAVATMVMALVRQGKIQLAAR